MANTIIKDPALIPFYISKDQYCFTVIEVITPDEKNIGKFKKKNNGNEGKDYEKPLSHHSSLASALKKIAKGKVDHKKDYSSIMSYIEEYKKETNAMEQLLNKIGI
jgi:Tfp pilus assembly protein PilF